MLDAVGDLLAAGDGVFQAGKVRVHLLRRAEIERVVLHPHPVGVGAELARVDAEQHVLGVGVFLVDVVGVAGRHQRNAQPLGQIDRRFELQPLDLDAVVHDLEEVPVAEHAAGTSAAISRASRKSSTSAPPLSSARLNSLDTQPERQMIPSLWRCQQLLVDPRLVVEAFQRRGRGQLDQVLEARAVLGQQRQVVAGLLAVGGVLLLEPAAGGDVGLVADDRVDARRPWPSCRTPAPRAGCRGR